MGTVQQARGGRSRRLRRAKEDEIMLPHHVTLVPDCETLINITLVKGGWWRLDGRPAQYLAFKARGTLGRRFPENCWLS